VRESEPEQTTKPSWPKNFQHPLFASFHLNSRHSEFLHHKETHFVYLKKKAKKIMYALPLPSIHHSHFKKTLFFTLDTPSRPTTTLATTKKPTIDRQHIFLACSHLVSYLLLAGIHLINSPIKVLSIILPDPYALLWIHKRR
jgi:hypothetical protein